MRFFHLLTVSLKSRLKTLIKLVCGCCDERMEDRGETIVGKKIGVTSQPVQEMLGVFQPDFGF